MHRLLEGIRMVKRDFEKAGYVCKDHEGKPFFGEVQILLNDGKMVHSRNKTKGEFDVAESIKL